MRGRAFALWLLLAGGTLGACSALDDFDRFHFTDAGVAGADLGLPGFGAACVDQCGPGLTCLHSLNGKTFAGGMCTHACNPTLGPVACSDVPDAVCAGLENMGLCLPRCDPSMGRACRAGYSCCANGHEVTMMGACAPPDTNLCH